LTASLKKNM